MRDDPFRKPLKKPWIPREMLIAPALAAHAAAPIESRYLLLINPFYAKDANASFGKHVLTPSLALTTLPQRLRRSGDSNTGTKICLPGHRLLIQRRKWSPSRCT